MEYAISIMNQLLKSIPWSFISQLLIGPVIAGLALFIANISLDIYRRPRLIIDKKNLLNPVETDLVLYRRNEKGFSKELSFMNVKYSIQRITIKIKEEQLRKMLKEY
jgi:hypothetical protein